MPQEFQLTERVCGVSHEFRLRWREGAVSHARTHRATEAHLLDRLEQIHLAVFAKIPGIPLPALTDHLLVVIRPDLTGTAYVNELRIRAMVRVNRDVEAGTPIHRHDITEVTSVDLAWKSPENAVIVVRSSGWRRSLFFDPADSSLSMGHVLNHWRKCSRSRNRFCSE